MPADRAVRATGRNGFARFEVRFSTGRLGLQQAQAIIASEAKKMFLIAAVGDRRFWLLLGSGGGAHRARPSLQLHAKQVDHRERSVGSSAVKDGLCDQSSLPGGSSIAGRMEPFPRAHSQIDTLTIAIDATGGIGAEVDDGRRPFRLTAAWWFA